MIGPKLSTAVAAVALVVVAADWGRDPVSTASAGSNEAERAPFDLLIRGGEVIDGTGVAPAEADVAIRDGRIVAVGDLAGAAAKREISADGRIVAPGFIDLHSHADGAFGNAGLSDPYLAHGHNLVAQGITTVVVGQDGWHSWPVGSRLDEAAARWREQGSGPNVIPLAGYLAVRREVMGWSREPPGPEQMRSIEGRIGAYLQQGAWGLSTGLEFSPYVSTEELVRALVPLKEADGVYFSHMRSQRGDVLPALDELLETARAAEVKAVVSHLKVVGPENWGSAKAAVERLRAARSEGVRVFADHTPYLTGAIDVSLVPESAVLTPEELEERLPPGAGPGPSLLAWAFRRSPAAGHTYTLEFLLGQDEQRVRSTAEGLAGALVSDESFFRSRLRAVLADSRLVDPLLEAVGERIDSHGGPELLRVYRHPEPEIVGRTLAEAAVRRGATPARVAAELTLEGVMFVPIQLSEEDVRTIVSAPFVAASSDGWIAEYGHGEHPRSYGAFIRRLQRYVVERGWLSWAAAIRGASGLPAEILGLEDRGRLLEGQWADIVVLDPGRLQDRASYEQPHRYPSGVEWVLVNGDAVVENGRLTGRRPGGVLLRAR